MNEKILEEHLISYSQMSSWEKVNLTQDLLGIELLFYQKCMLAMMYEADNIFPNKRKFLF
jgi:hypothetical protein